LVQFNFKRYSRIYSLGTSNVRHWFDAGYAQQINQRKKNGLDIRDVNGLYGYKPDSLSGTRRLTFQTEAIAFTTWKVLGFHLAPVARLDLAVLMPSNENFFRKENLFSGYSIALFARNENLIFNTVEARIYYFPHTVENISHLRVEFRTNIRIKYPTNLVNAPGTVYDP
jgi:hypothetical protein